MNPDDVFVNPDGKAMFVQLKLVTQDVQLMACAPMERVSVLTVRTAKFSN